MTTLQTIKDITVTQVQRPTQGSKKPISEQTPAVASESFDLDSPEWYLNRELTWLSFNRRVLNEAEDERTPLLERIKFLAIVSSNLDEFFMKRIGGLKHQICASVSELSIDGRTPQQQISHCYTEVREIIVKQHALSLKLEGLLRENEIFIHEHKELSKIERDDMREYFLRNIFPLLTPQAMDPAHPFPFISGLSLNLLASVRYKDGDDIRLVRIKVPVGSGIRRFVQLGNENRFIPLEELIANNLDLLFPGMVVESCELFRVTRNAITEQDEEEADDLLQMIESELRERKFSSIVRLEIGKNTNPVHRGMLAAELGLDEEADVFVVDGLMAKRDLFQIVGIDAPSLHDAPHHPIDHPKLVNAPNIFHVIRDEGSILLHHPYESFTTSVERLVKEASRDSKVRAIKMTLYRTSEDSKIIGYLIDAALNGKQVTVAVELKARFDEKANIRWASRLEQVGIHVTYGIVGLKTHSKVIYIVRQDYSGLRRYAHIGTGNYHAGTARLYTDLGLLTCDPIIGEDLTEFFNYLTTGFVPKRNYRKLLPAPRLLKATLLEKINREIKNHSAKTPGLIQFKMNALEDKDITSALYRAAQEGVKIDLIVRDTCRLRPGIQGLSETVRVSSVVGRFLEHSRIYYFQNKGDEEFFIGSADCMKRNLESRVEVVTPIEPQPLRDQLRLILDTLMADQRQGWDMRPDGSYVQRQPEDPDNAVGAQELLIKLADRRLKEATRLKKRKPQNRVKR